MSVMMLTKKHYQFIADCLYRIGVQYDRSMPFQKTRSYFGADSATDRTKNIITFINKLQDLNLDSYDSRYPIQADPNYKPEYVTHIEPLNAVFDACQFLKAVDCVNYQCSESDRYYKSSDAEMVEIMSDEAMRCIIEELDSYKAAKWGLD